LLLRDIEPRREERNTIIFREEDEYLEIIFFSDGAYKVGYSLKA